LSAAQIARFSHSLFWRVFSFWPLLLQQDACDFLIPMPLLQPNSYKGVFSREETLSKDSLLPVLGSRFVSNSVGVTGALDMSKAERAQVHASDHQVVCTGYIQQPRTRGRR